MKVLHVLNELKPSGAETMLCIAAQSFSEKGVNAEVLSTGAQLGAHAPQFEKAGYKIHHLPFSHSPRFFFMLYRLFRAGKYDAIHLHTERANFWIGLTALLAMPGRVLRTIHSNFDFTGGLRIRRSLQRKLLSLLGLVHVSIGPSVQKNELTTFGLKTRRVPNWYDDTKFIPATHAEYLKARIEFNLPENRVVVVTVGNCSKVKNHESLIHAMAMLPAEIRPIYLHVGNEEAGFPERKLTNKLGISETVKFFGPLTDIRTVLAASDVFVMPSLYEGFSIAAIEGFASGLPAILTDVPGLRDFRSEYVGVRYAQTDVESIRDALCEFLKMHPDDRRMLAKNYAEKSQKLYGIEKGVSGYFKIYSGC